MSQVDRLRISYFAQQERELKRLIDPKTGLLSKKFSRIISCPSCKTKKYEKIFVKRGYTFVRCKKCGLVYTNPQVKNELVENFYSGKKSKAEKIEPTPNNIYDYLLSSVYKRKEISSLIISPSNINQLKNSIKFIKKLEEINRLST